MTDVAILGLDALRRSPLFAGLAESDLEHLAGFARRLVLPPGTRLFQEGSPGDMFFVILDGEIEVSRTKGGVDVLLDVVGPGEFLSEMSLLEDRPRSASAWTRTTAELLALDPQGFRDLLGRSPSAALTMLTTVTARLRSTQASLVEQGRLAGLGTLAAGLAHELNNPAAALVRSSSLLADSVSRFEERRAEMGQPAPDTEEERLVAEMKAHGFLNPARSSGLRRSGRAEADLETWLTERGAEASWDMASALAEAGWDLAWARETERRLDGSRLLPFLQWAAAGADVHTILAEIQAASRSISAIVGSVRSYAHLDQGPVQTVDLAESISNTLAILKGRIGPGITVLTAIPSDLPSIEARGGELGQVWTNIIHNALDAMGERGTLSIEAREENGSVSVRIGDTGHGIPDEVRSRIFDPFFTTKAEGLGTGLGLAITHGIVVNQHRGTIEVESSPRGTTFQITLPLRLIALP